MAVDVRDEVEGKLRMAYAASAATAICGPRSLPPMPILTTWRSGRSPLSARARTASAKASIASSTACTSLEHGASPGGARKAVCSMARPSVLLIAAPANIASHRAAPRRRIRARGRQENAASPHRRDSSRGRRRARALRRRSARSATGRARKPRADRDRARALRSGRARRPGGGRVAARKAVHRRPVFVVMGGDAYCRPVRSPPRARPAGGR